MLIAIGYVHAGAGVICNHPTLAGDADFLPLTLLDYG